MSSYSKTQHLRSAIVSVVLHILQRRSQTTLPCEVSAEEVCLYVFYRLCIFLCFPSLLMSVIESLSVLPWPAIVSDVYAGEQNP